MTREEPTSIGPRSLVYKNQYQEIYQVRVQFEDFQKDIFVNCFGERAAMLFVRDREVLMIRQFRLLANGLAWEIPGGKIDPNETPAQAAAREGLEESGYRCKSVYPLLYFHPGLDTHDNPTFIFFCVDFEEAPGEHFHSNEISDRVWLPLARCIEMIFAREIVDSLTIAALLAYKTISENPNLAPK
jgi:8-oxo-dGTP pyrophosphatase MutT (NUDIX family)